MLQKYLVKKLLVKLVADGNFISFYSIIQSLYLEFLDLSKIRLKKLSGH